MRTYAAAVAVLSCLVITGAPINAQESHTASPSAIDAALQAHVNSVDADRAAVLRLLERNEVKSVAGEAGIDLRTAADAVRTMGAADLARVAPQAAQVESALAGGQSRIVISTTAIIIGLLLLILIIVAVN